MASVEPLYKLLDGSLHFSNSNASAIEIILFFEIFEELKEILYKESKQYYSIIKLNYKLECEMLDYNVVSFIIKDIISSDGYNLEGIALYTDTHEDIIYDVMIGSNPNPSVILVRKLVDLHRHLKPDFYKTMIEKLLDKYSTNKKDNLNSRKYTDSD